MLAAAKGQLEVAQLLLAAGANPRLKDNFGHTAT
jgi:ankyrin repeat protein